MAELIKGLIFISIYFVKDHFIECEDKQFNPGYNICRDEGFIFNILDFYVEYGMCSLLSHKSNPNIIIVKFHGSDSENIKINTCGNKTLIAEEMLDEISFAHKIIEEYASKNIYDLLCEEHQLRQK